LCWPRSEHHRVFGVSLAIKRAMLTMLNESHALEQQYAARIRIYKAHAFNTVKFEQGKQTNQKELACKNIKYKSQGTRP